MLSSLQIYTCDLLKRDSIKIPRNMQTKTWKQALDCLFSYIWKINSYEHNSSRP